MSFIEETLAKAARMNKHIVLPEGNDPRIQEAVAPIIEKDIARLTVLGPVDETAEKIKAAGGDPGKITILDPKSSDHKDRYAALLYELRKHKGITEEKAHKIVEDEIYFGTMMLKAGDADGLVAGACHATGDTLRPALQVIKSAGPIKTISSMFFMCWPDKTLLYADCGLLENPDAHQLADIAVSTAMTAISFGFPTRIGMLSYSTKGSAQSEATQKVIEATVIAKEKIAEMNLKDVIIDGELQFDAAYVPEVAKSKCPDSPLKGNANIFIFPDLGVGNICYKATQRLAGAEAYGPILQGMAKPVNDLSRGCSAEDVVGAVAITALQAG